MDDNKIKQIYLPPSFTYPKLNEKHRIYGGDFLLNPVIRPDGDWRKSLPPHEAQRRNNVEPSSCYVEAQQHTNATIEEDQLGETDNNYSARFNALLSGGTEVGGDPIAGADSIRHDGMVREEAMPHDETIKSWADFHSWKGVDKAKTILLGLLDLKKKGRRFGVIVQREYPLETKYTLLQQGLMRSPICMSVWGVTDAEGNYLPKPEGVSDTHMVEATYLDVEKKIIHILDTYPPFEKTLPANYNFDFAMGWTVKKIEPKLTFWQRLIMWLNKRRLAFGAQDLPRWLIVHHTGGTQDDPQADTSHHTFEDVNAWHRKDPNVWLGKLSSLGYSIGYHYFIDKTGKVTQGRADTEQAAHCQGYNNNPWDLPSHKAIGIALAGNFDVTFPTQAQISSLTRLLAEKMSLYGIPRERIVPHRFASGKSCYGRNLPDKWASNLFQEPSEMTKPTQCTAQEQTIAEQRSIISNLKSYIAILTSFFRRS